MREELPLQTLLFKQVSPHLAHEGNAEETFSLSGKLSNDNTHTQPGFLATLVRINKNRSRCDPSASDILKGYKKKYGKLPELGEDVVPDAEAGPEAVRTLRTRIQSRRMRTRRTSVQLPPDPRIRTCEACCVSRYCICFSDT